MARLRSGARNRRESAQAFGVGFVIGLAALALLMATHGQPGSLRRTSQGPSLPVVAEPSGRVPVQAGTIPERTVFRMKDPPGDDNGPGTYVYPTDETFVPGLFDLTDFAVRTAGDQVYFDLTFREVNNPWGAPEGFYHQLIDIYIDTVPGRGSTEPLRPGPQVRFHPAHAWDVRVRAAPFGGTRLHRATDPPDAAGRTRGVSAHVLDDGRTIRIAVAQAAIGAPERSWRYYVLVGGFDAFGEDNYRPVDVQPTAWRFGGGDPAAAGPRVIDILAPRWPRSQAGQLASFAERGDGLGDSGRVSYALVHPVGPGQNAWVVAAGFLTAAGIAGVWLVRRSRGTRSS